MGRSSAYHPPYAKRLGPYAPFFIMLGAIVAAAFAYYRIHAISLLLKISPDLTASALMGGYFPAALASDALAAAFVFTALTALWLLCPLSRGLAAGVSLPVAAASAAFLVLSVDFMRVYQTAFRKSFVGGEHFTGLGSMLGSAVSELSDRSLIVLLSLAVLLAAACVLSIALGKIPVWAFRGSLRFQRMAASAATIAFAACLVAGWPMKYSGRTAAADPKRPADFALALELSANPLSALAFGPERATYLPPEIPKASPAFYDTDSLERPGVDRPLPLAKKGKLNLVLYFFESMSWRYYDLARSGEYVVPNMRRLAEKGLLLREHYSNYPLSANTLYSVLSSRYSVYGKAMIFREYGDVDVRTLPEVLSGAGYSSCFVHSGDLLYAARDKFLADRDIGTMMLEKDLSKDPRYGKKVGWGADERSMIDPAVEWIEAREGPWFLMMSPVSPHHPYAIPEGFPEFVDPDEEGIGEGERNFRNYLNSLHYADAAMGEFVDALEERGLMENAVFMMVTDHGEAFYQHKGNYNHPLLIYEENVHVPALFYGPAAIPAQAPFASVTRHVDIMPSLLDLLGVEDSGHRDGESIFSLSREKMAVFHTSWTDELMGVRDGKWKYVKRIKDSREELYDIIADPFEKDDVSAENAAAVERYRAVADGMVSYMIHQYEDIPRKGAPARIAAP